MLKVTLSLLEQKELQKLRTKTGSACAERALIVLLSHQGHSPVEIANKIHRNPHTVRLWIKRFLESRIPGLERRYSPGRPRKHKGLLLKLLPEWLAKGPSSYGYMASTWTVDLLCSQFRQVTGDDLSRDTIERALKRLGYSYRRAKKVVPSSAPSKEEKKKRVLELVEEINNYIGQDDAVILSVDETHLSSEPYLIRGWYKKNSISPSYAAQKGELHDLWCVEYQGTKIYLEKCQERK